MNGVDNNKINNIRVNLRGLIFTQVDNLVCNLRNQISNDIIKIPLFERSTRIELVSKAWQALILPLNHDRIGVVFLSRKDSCAVRNYQTCFHTINIIHLISECFWNIVSNLIETIFINLDYNRIHHQPQAIILKHSL